MLRRLHRILRHRWHDEAAVRRVLPPAALQRLQQRVADSERRHSGELRVYVEAGLPLGYLWRERSPRDRAVTLFGKLRVWDTEQNNGVLIYLLLAEHAIEIVADRGLNRHVDAQEWADVIARMREPLRAGRFDEALLDAVDGVGAMLQRHFPLAPGEANPNELPDEPVIG